VSADARIGKRYAGATDETGKSAQFLMRSCRNASSNPSSCMNLEVGGVDRIATKSREEIDVLFKNDDVDPGTRQKKNPASCRRAHRQLCSSA